MNYVWTCVRSAWGGSTFTKISYNDPYPGHCARESCYSYNKRYVQGSIKSCATPACGVGRIEIVKLKGVAEHQILVEPQRVVVNEEMTVL